MKRREMIEVKQTAGGDPLGFDVAVTSDGTTTRHHVTMSAGDCARLAGGAAPDQVIEAAFRFLLEREPKESILARFDMQVIGTYFPEFERTLPEYLGFSSTARAPEER